MITEIYDINELPNECYFSVWYSFVCSLYKRIGDKVILCSHKPVVKELPEYTYPLDEEFERSFNDHGVYVILHYDRFDYYEAWNFLVDKLNKKYGKILRTTK